MVAGCTLVENGEWAGYTAAVIINEHVKNTSNAAGLFLGIVTMPHICFGKLPFQCRSGYRRLEVSAMLSRGRQMKSICEIAEAFGKRNTQVSTSYTLESRASTH
jgi:hypothetical protein